MAKKSAPPQNEAEALQLLKTVEREKQRAAGHLHVLLTPEQRAYLGAYFRNPEFTFSMRRIPGEDVFRLEETPLFRAIRQALYGMPEAGIKESSLPANFTEDDLLLWALDAKNGRRPVLSAEGLRRARELNLTPGDCGKTLPQANPTAAPTDTDGEPEKKSKRGRKPYPKKVQQRDLEIYRQHKFSKKSYSDIALYFDMSEREVKTAYDRERKRQERKK